MFLVFFRPSPARFAGPEPRWLILVFHISIVASRCWHRRKPSPKYRYWHFCCHFRRNSGLRYSHRSILQLSRWPFTNGSVHSVWIHGDDNVAKILVYHPVSEFILKKATWNVCFIQKRMNVTEIRLQHRRQQQQPTAAAVLARIFRIHSIWIVCENKFIQQMLIAFYMCAMYDAR